jgi:hypothetical protein
MRFMGPALRKKSGVQNIDLSAPRSALYSGITGLTPSGFKTIAAAIGNIRFGQASQTVQTASPDR